MSEQVKFTTFPNFIVDYGILQRMTPAEAKVYLVIARSCSNKTKIGKYSIQGIISKAGIHRVTAFKAIKGLEKLKVIKTWIHRISKYKSKKFFQLNRETYSMGEILRRIDTHDKKTKKLAETHKERLIKAKEIHLLNKSEVTVKDPILQPQNSFSISTSR